MQVAQEVPVFTEYEGSREVTEDEAEAETGPCGRSRHDRDHRVRVSLRNDDKLRLRQHHAQSRVRHPRAQIIRAIPGCFVRCPAQRPDGQHQDLAHPINDVTRKYLTQKVMEEYERELANPSHVPQTMDHPRRGLLGPTDPGRWTEDRGSAPRSAPRPVISGRLAGRRPPGSVAVVGLVTSPAG